MNAVSAYQAVADALAATGRPVTNGMARCPSHEDPDPSLSVTETDGKVLINCFAGCNTDVIVAAIGLAMSDLFDNTMADRTVDEYGTPHTARRSRNSNAKPAARTTPTTPPPTTGPAKPDRTKTDPYDVHYPYLDVDGTYLYSVLRWNPTTDDPKKDFRQRIFHTDNTGQPRLTAKPKAWSLKGVQRVLYRLPRTVAAVKRGDEVWFVEGEKDVHALVAAGATATTTSQGAAGFKQFLADNGLAHLDGANVVVWPDDDDAGRKYSATLTIALNNAGANVIAVAAPDLAGVKDAADYLAAGHDLDDLQYCAIAGDDSLPSPHDWAAGELVRQQAIADAKKTAAQALNTPATSQSPPNAPLSDDPPAVQPATDPDDDFRPSLEINNRPQEDMVEDVVEHLLARNTPPVIFEQMGALVRLNESRPGRPSIEPHTSTTMSRRIGRVVNCMKVGAKGPVDALVPRPIAELVMADDDQPFPHIESVSFLPILLMLDNRIVFNNERGYDPESCTWYEPLVDIPAVEDNPDEADVLAARDLLAPLMADFPFDNDSSRAHAWAALFTPLLRSAVGGSVPLNLVTAPKQGSGKSFLPELIAAVSTGEAMQSTRWETDDTEMTKMLMALLLAGQAVATFDNQTKVLKSNVMANLITSGTLVDRRLGHNDQSLVATDRCTWFVTGNNMKTDSDFARRIARIRLDAKMVRPERRDFKNDALDDWALANRGDILHAMLTIVRSWSNAGCPPDPRDARGQTNKGFSKWIHVVGGVVRHGRFGELEPGEGLSRLLEIDPDDDHDVSDDEGNDEVLLLGMLKRWPDRNIAKAPTWANIDEALLDGASTTTSTDPDHYANVAFLQSVPSWIVDVVRSKRTSVVKSHLESMKDRPYGEHSIRLAIGKDRRKTKVYLVEYDGEGPGADATTVDALGFDIGEPF